MITSSLCLQIRRFPCHTPLLMNVPGTRSAKAAVLYGTWFPLKKLLSQAKPRDALFSFYFFAVFVCEGAGVNMGFSRVA